jgi:hypothetical protein
MGVVFIVCDFLIHSYLDSDCIISSHELPCTTEILIQEKDDDVHFLAVCVKWCAGISDGRAKNFVTRLTRIRPRAAHRRREVQNVKWEENGDGPSASADVKFDKILKHVLNCVLGTLRIFATSSK